jgi:hypothetical protein
VEPLPAAPKPKVVEIKAPEQKVRQISQKIPRRRKEKLSTKKAGASSSRQKTSIIMFIIFSAALVFVLARPYLPSREKPGPSRKPEKTDPVNLTIAAIVIDWPVPSVYSTNFRDPMVIGEAPPTEPKTLTDLVVRGISWSEDRKFATIGTQTVQEGDTILGATIVEINPNNVVFERDGERWTQEVEGEK